MTGKSEFRNKDKETLSKIIKSSEYQQNNGTISLQKEIEFSQDENAKHSSSGKFWRKKGPKNLALKSSNNHNYNGNEAKIDGHNYTVSINFNRPQQSKGKRIKLGKYY